MTTLTAPQLLLLKRLRIGPLLAYGTRQADKRVLPVLVRLGLVVAQVHPVLGPVIKITDAGNVAYLTKELPIESNDSV